MASDEMCAGIQRIIAEYGPGRLEGQGLDANQFESGDRTIEILLTKQPASDQVDFVATWRNGAYEVWARRGMIRFKRLIDSTGDLRFRIIEQIGENPIARQDPFTIGTIGEELMAASTSGFPTEDPNAAYSERRLYRGGSLDLPARLRADCSVF